MHADFASCLVYTSATLARARVDFGATCRPDLYIRLSTSCPRAVPPSSERHQLRKALRLRQPRFLTAYSGAVFF
ncbi:hypothetical protein WJX73_004968 [Symbiochloris irregularis]|uniref:Uncharacterized protein n=1 Tax=Symbiochloris irregularis TaxID=706552 RepID=A0AAW1P1P9_9CHLO